MVMKMNKSKFINELAKETGYSEEKCILINNILENYFIFSKSNREKVIQDLKLKVGLSEDDSENIYDISMKIIRKEIKDKIRHPFKSKN